jgi:hypothetical protein
MKTGNNNKFAQATCTILMVLVLTSMVFAYPPDNAAVLYYRASLNYNVNDTMKDKLTGLIKGNIDIDEEIKAYVQSNKIWIKQYVDAGEAPYSDWGVDYSQGIATLMPPFAPLRNMANIVLAQAKITAESKDYNRALNLCLSVHKAGNHIASGGILISHLVGIRLNEYANQCTADILGDISDNPEILIRLRGQIFDVSGKFPSIRNSLNRDLKTYLRDICKERASYVLETAGDHVPKEQARIIRQGDEYFFKANKEYFLNQQAAVLTAIELSYPKSFEELVRLEKKTGLESKKNPHAILTDVFMPAISKCLCLDIRSRTHFNAVKAAIEIYLIKAKTGKLPDALPAGLPKDLFSGKNFKYEKTKDGFILNCQGKDLSKDEIYKYEFKVKK